jgi:hypothetical protein
MDQKHHDFRPGDRVRVTITDMGAWAHGAGASLDGRVGIVEEVGRSGLTLLVKFDEPAPKWWEWQSQVKAWWFDPVDVKPEGGTK